MNILEAREAAMAGKTVIDPNGDTWTSETFKEVTLFGHKTAFGEWKEKREPRVFWVNEYHGGLAEYYLSSKEEADRVAKSSRIACVKFVEVIEP